MLDGSVKKGATERPTGRHSGMHSSPFATTSVFALLGSSRRARTALGMGIFCAIASAACSTFTASADPPVAAPAAGADGGPVPDGPHAPPVPGTPDPSEFTEEFGVFVAPKGTPGASGTRERPLASIQAAIDLAQSLGKRVYVCAGTYRESLVVANSISVIGGLACPSGAWTVSSARSRVEAPSSPALVARNITAPTRIDGLEVIAPQGTDVNLSSIALVADVAPSLTVARSVLRASNAKGGASGVEGVQLALDQAAATGTAGEVARERSSIPQGGAGGTSVCVNAAGHNGGSGGSGGKGGNASCSQCVSTPIAVCISPYGWYATSGRPAAPGGAPSGAASSNGMDGSNAVAGTFGAQGYLPSDGKAGSDGTPGAGGVGGAGAQGAREATKTCDAAYVGGVWGGSAGNGGGAGGCPGLAGTPGTGGGASVAALVFMSPGLTFDSSELVAGDGGQGGQGTLGSDATAGGQPIPALGLAGAPSPGQPGGTSGVSGNGNNGPSVAVVHSGPAPTLRTTRTTHGQGGALMPERSRDSLGVTRTVPATPAGAAQDILAL